MSFLRKFYRNTVDALAGQYRRDKVGWGHFGGIVVFLLVVTVGWNVAMDTLGYWTRKEPVAWPANVRVDEKDFRNVSLPRQFGPYRLYQGTKQANGLAEGEIIFRDDLKETLKIGTSLDKSRYEQRKSNWYLARVYEDTRQKKNSPFRFWQLGIEFYTGGEVTVPHVPDICILAGGATPLGREILRMDLPRGLANWRKNVPFVGLYYENSRGGAMQELVQYYLFCVNGEPQTNRNMVRAILTKLTLRYIYYAKIQFFPRGAVFDRGQADLKAKEFLRYCLPAILRELPSGEVIEKLHSSKTKEQ